MGKNVKRGRERDDACEGCRGEEEKSEEEGGREINKRSVGLF